MSRYAVVGGSPAGESEERRLVRGFLRSRDEASFRRLYRLHTPLLYRVIRRLVDLDDLAEDVLQETWVRAVTGLSRFRGDSSLRTWLVGIAVRCCHETRRATRQYPVSATQNEGVEPTAPTTAALTRLDLERALAALPPGRREILLLHDVEGFTHAEIAAALELDPGTSKSQLSRARTQLRRHLAAGPGGARHPQESNHAR